MSVPDQVPRREFLLQGSAATAVGVAGFHAAQAEAHATAKQGVSPELLDKFVGEPFTASVESTDYGRQSAQFVLREVKSHRSDSDHNRPAHVRRESFSLLFEPMCGSELGDGIYRLQHPKLGSEELFLSKTVRGQRQREHFVAVFN